MVLFITLRGLEHVPRRPAFPLRGDINIQNDDSFAHHVQSVIGQRSIQHLSVASAFDYNYSMLHRCTSYQSHIIIDREMAQGPVF